MSTHKISYKAISFSLRTRSYQEAIQYYYTKQMKTCTSKNCDVFTTKETIAFIDIEGQYYDTVEVGIIVLWGTWRAPAKSVVYHARPTAVKEFWQASLYCHGLQEDDLSQIGFKDQDQLRSEVRKLIEKYNIKYFIGHDGLDAKQSDNEQFLRLAGIEIEYHNHPIHNWRERRDQGYHIKALKKKSEPIFSLGRGRTICPAQHKPIRIGNKGARETVEAKREAGPHCGLVDAYELFLYHLSQ